MKEESSDRSAIPAPHSSPADLLGAMVLAAVLALLATALWASVIQSQSMAALGTIFFLTVGASWAVLIPARLWTTSLEDSLGRRLVMLLLGVLVGLEALWLDGWTLDGGLHGSDSPGSPVMTVRDVPVQPSLTEAATYVSYFAIVFLALRWWKMTDRRRGMRFSMQPILATGFWALLLLLVWKNLEHGATALVMTSVIVQLVSPWEPPPPPASRRLRMRYA